MKVTIKQRTRRTERGEEVPPDFERITLEATGPLPRSGDWLEFSDDGGVGGYVYDVVWFVKGGELTAEIILS